MREGTGLGGAIAGCGANRTGSSCVYHAATALAVIATGNALNACRSETVWFAQTLDDIGIESPPCGIVSSSQQSCSVAVDSIGANPPRSIAHAASTRVACEKASAPSNRIESQRLVRRFMRMRIVARVPGLPLDDRRFDKQDQL